MGVKGFIFSIEALLAAVFLFAVFIFVANITDLDSGSSQAPRILSRYTDGTLSALELSGALDDLFKLKDDSKLKNISDSMPGSLCTQIEIYNSSQALFYSYSQSSCSTSWDSPVQVQYSTYLNRTNRTSVNIFWIKAIHYAKK